jgi:hypothetical protein
MKSNLKPYWNQVSKLSNDIKQNIALSADKIKSYLNDGEYESDLDTVISALYMHKPDAAPKFANLAVDKERLYIKTNFVKEQIALFIAASGATGMNIGTYLGKPELGFMIGTATGIIIVVVVCGVVIVKRISKPGFLTKISAG